MKIVLFTIAALLALMAGSVSADIASGADHSFLWNEFNSVTASDKFVVATTDYGVALLTLDGPNRGFDIAGNLSLPNQACDAKIVGDTVIVTSCVGIVYLVDLTLAPELRLVGEIDLDMSIHDLTLTGEFLYLACGFDGLRQYRLNASGPPVFVDSTIAPIHCIQVDVRGDDLLVLDDYNGILRFDLAPNLTDKPTNTLFLPRRAASFHLAGENLLIGLVDQKLIYIGQLTSEIARVTDSLLLQDVPDAIMTGDTLMVAVNIKRNRMYVYPFGGQLSMRSLHQTWELEPIGFVTNVGPGAHLFLVSRVNGLADYTLHYPASAPTQAYARPGPITSLAFYQDRLATGGVRNPLELYDLGTNDVPVFDTAVYGINNVGSMVAGGEVLLTHFPSLGLVSSLSVSETEIQILGNLDIPVYRTPIFKHYDYLYADSLSLLLMINQKHIDLTSVSPTGQLAWAGMATALETILDAVVVDSFLLISTSGRQLHAYRIFNDFSTRLWWSVTSPGTLDHMMITGRRYYDGGPFFHRSLTLAFDGRDMYEINLTDDGLPEIDYMSSLPVEVLSSAQGDGSLFTIGSQGIARIDLTEEQPQLVAYGGNGGHLIAYGDSTLAVSDGTAIELYSYRETGSAPSDNYARPLPHDQLLRPNYPNPFNPRTQIDFEILTPTRVELTVYNLLGRKVRTLLDGYMTVGNHTIEWNGIDQNGQPVASGVYLYRMKTEAASETRKMILLK